MMNGHLQQKLVSVSLTLTAHCTNTGEENVRHGVTAYRRNFLTRLNIKMGHVQY